MSAPLGDYLTVLNSKHRASNEYKRGDHYPLSQNKSDFNLATLYKKKCKRMVNRYNLDKFLISVNATSNGGTNLKVKVGLWSFNGIELFHSPGRFEPFGEKQLAQCTNLE